MNKCTSAAALLVSLVISGVAVSHDTELIQRLSHAKLSLGSKLLSNRNLKPDDVYHYVTGLAVVNATTSHKIHIYTPFDGLAVPDYAKYKGGNSYRFDMIGALARQSGVPVKEVGNSGSRLCIGSYLEGKTQDLMSSVRGNSVATTSG